MLDTPAVWDIESNVETLKRMWIDGSSASEIARELGQGITRLAVIGKVHRLKLPARDNSIRARPSAQHGNKGVTPAASIIRRAKGRAKASGGGGRAFKIGEARKQGLSVEEAMPLVLGRPAFREGSLPEMDEGVDVTSLIGFSDRRIGKQCAWIPGDALGGAMCCGKPTVEGTEWCAEHRRRVYGGRAGLAD